MSDQNVKVLIKISPKNPPEELAAMLQEFDAVEELDGKKLLTVPKTNQLVTDEGHLLIVLPDRLDFAIALEPDEFVILMEQTSTEQA